MPFEIVRNDITMMRADAIVNTANPKPVIGSGVDMAIHKKAGPRLLEARKQIGDIAVGSAAITPAFDLDAKYVIHVSGPLWMDGEHQEVQLLQQCYEKALALALDHHCESIVFPLISTGNYGFPKDLALQIATRMFSSFLLEHEMQITLAVFSNEAFELSEKLYYSVKSYIDAHYVSEKTIQEYGAADYGRKPSLRSRLSSIGLLTQEAAKKKKADSDVVYSAETKVCATIMEDSSIEFLDDSSDINDILASLDAGFSETLLHLIDMTGKKDSEIYKKANVDRKLFSKIRNNPAYQPKKTTALAFALALELDLEETKDLIARAGYALSHSSKLDLIVEFFIKNKNYDIFELNEVLFKFDQPLIGY